MKILTDNPITSKNDDLFGFDPFATILAQIVIDTDSLPFCVGIFGEWGTGKTSLMRIIEEKIILKPEIKSLWFNPWKYDKKEELWNALIQSILYKIKENGKSTRVKDKATELAKSTTWLFLKKGASKLTGGLVSEENVDKVIDTFAKKDEKHYKYLNHFEESFKEVIMLYTADDADGNEKSLDELSILAKTRKLVIFIDDLDRCLPENAITVLESLKLFIGDANCVFILGMDHFIVEEGIKVRFGDKVKMNGRDYLEKIIQVPFFLPPVSFPKLKDAFNNSVEQYSEDIWHLIEHGLSGNPRKTKRFINCFYLLKKVLYKPETVEGTGKLSHLTEQIQNFYLAKLLIFQIVFPDFYSYLKINPSAWEIYESQLINGNASSKQSIFVQFPPLEKFWLNDNLQKFMDITAKTNTNTFPVSPNKDIVTALLKAVNLIDMDKS